MTASQNVPTQPIPVAGAAGSNGADGSPAPARPSAVRRFLRFFIDRLDRVSMSAKLVSCTLVVLIIGTAGISFSIRQLVGNYLIDKIDTQLSKQAQLVYENIDLLSQDDGGEQTSAGLTDYYLQIRDASNRNPVTRLQPVLRNGVTSVPLLPVVGTMTGVTPGEPFTTDAVVRLGAVAPDHATLQAARAPWRVVAKLVVDKDDSGRQYVKNVAYIGLSLNDQIDTTNTLTRYCVMVSIAIVLLGGSLAAIVIQRTLTPLKRIEKTAAKIAAGDLSQRVPTVPENTEVGSLSASLNAMLARIESSFREQQETTAKMKRFVSDASHELRTPLAAIHGYAELYKMQRDMPGALERADESISHIERSSARMTVLVEDLLSLARLDEGRGIDMTQSVSLNTLVQDATDDLHALDPQREVTCGTVVLAPADGMDRPASLRMTDGAPPAVTLTGDGSRLRQVVTNIVGNIHRYTPSDSPAQAALGVMPASMAPEQLAALPSTDASMRRFLEAAEVGQAMRVGTNYAVLRFVDHGPGVPDESRPQLFERFYTADPSRAREKGGTGLGLAIAQSVVKAHHGLICATATDGGGLTFTIVLPIGPVEPPAGEDVPSADAPARQGKVRALGKSWFGSK